MSVLPNPAAGVCDVALPDTPTFTKRADGAPTYARGKKWPAWFLLAIPFTVVLVPLWHAARRRVAWFACGATILIFELLMLPVEHESLMRGHWVYNQNRILGPLVWGIPIEEPLFYYCLPPLLVILLFECVDGLKSGAIKLGHRTVATLRGAGGHARHRPVHAFASVATFITIASQVTPAPVQSLLWGPVQGWLDRKSDRQVMLRYDLVPGGEEIRGYNRGEVTARQVTLELTLAAPVDPARVRVHVPRYVESSLLTPPEDGRVIYAIKTERLFPRQSSTDEEYLSIRPGARILKVEFVSDEARGKESEESRTRARPVTLPALPEAAE